MDLLSHDLASSRQGQGLKKSEIGEEAGDKEGEGDEADEYDGYEYYDEEDEGQTVHEESEFKLGSIIQEIPSELEASPDKKNNL